MMNTSIFLTKVIHEVIFLRINTYFGTPRQCNSRARDTKPQR